MRRSSEGRLLPLCRPPHPIHCGGYPCRANTYVSSRQLGSQRSTLQSAMSETKSGERELDRLIFFSDAVFAIVMTLLVLEIRVPEVPLALAAAEVPNEVLALGPKFFSYVLSFLVIGTYWIAHHQTLRYVQSYDRRLLWLNLLFLLSISFIPFPTALLVHLQERFWAMSCSAAYELTKRTTRSLVNAHKASLSIAQNVS